MRLIQLFALLHFAACTGEAKDTAVPTDTDTSADTDTDTAADTDTDTDTDTDSDTDTDCTSVPACGGDPTGAWTVSRVCVDSSPQPMEDWCPSGSITVSDISIPGTLEFDASHDYRSEFTSFSITTVTHLPATCVGGMECAAVAESMESGSTCVAAADGCDCTYTAVNPGASGIGTWSVSDTTLTLTPTTGASSSQSFCVDGNNLWVATPPESVPSFTLLLTK